MTLRTGLLAAWALAIGMAGACGGNAPPPGGSPEQLDSSADVSGGDTSTERSTESSLETSSDASTNHDDREVSEPDASIGPYTTSIVGV